MKNWHFGRSGVVIVPLIFMESNITLKKKINPKNLSIKGKKIEIN